MKLVPLIIYLILFISNYADVVLLGYNRAFV